MYYNAKRLPDGYRIVKFDNLYNVEAIYNLRFSRGKFYCDCPAYGNVSCKHRDMIHAFIENKAVDTGKFLCYDTGEWHPAIEGIVDELPPQPPKKKSIRPTRKSTRRYSY